MTTFDDREHAFENKFAHDKEMEFKASARRNKLLGLWAAAQMNLSEEDRRAYARAIATAELDGRNSTEEDAIPAGIVYKILADFSKAGISLGEKDIRQEMLRLEPIALEQLRAE